MEKDMKKAPEFSLPDQAGKIRTLKEFAGRWIVLYFYPKDNTPGCTKEACNFRDERDAIAEYGNAVVVGVSKDSVASHANFAKKHNINFTILSDSENTTIKAYGSWKETTILGMKKGSIKRNTYLISPDGYIAKEYLGVNPVTHAAQIIKDLQELSKK
jgi:peroxiredoxin Q/BCP